MEPVAELKPTRACSKCGQNFLEDDLIQYSDIWICASCKPLVFQTLKETGELPDFLNEGPQFFAVSKTKLIIMWFCTFGLYRIYWFYKNWSLVKERTGDDIQPASRSIFAVFFVYQLFQLIKESAQLNNVACSWSPGVLATGYILISLARALRGVYTLIGFLNVFPLVAVQGTINEINAKVAPTADKNEHFSAKNIAAMIVGLIFLGLVLLGIIMKAI